MVDPSGICCTEGLGVISTAIAYIRCIPMMLLVFAMGDQYQHHFFIYVKNIIWRTLKNLKTIIFMLKTWMVFAGQLLIKLETYFIRGFL